MFKKNGKEEFKNILRVKREGDTNFGQKQRNFQRKIFDKVA